MSAAGPTGPMHPTDPTDPTDPTRPEDPVTETRTADEPLSGPTPGPAPDPAGASAAPERPAPRGPDAPAVALGLAALTAAVLVALVELTGVRVDVGLVVPLGLLALGALLVAGGVVTGLARRDRHPR